MHPTTPPPATLAAPRPAATLIFLRDTPSGPEALMLKRHGLSDVLGEAYVFPGGKVDAADLALATDRSLDESLASLHARLAEPACDPATAATLFVAAIREAFEECGVLLCVGDVTQGWQVAERLSAGASFGDALIASGIRLRAAGLLPWSRWITPVSPLQAKRFDTRFFMARAPLDAVAQHDGRETTATAWMRPRIALERYWAGDMALAPPQIMTLAHLTRHDNVDSILAEARDRPPFLIEPAVLQSASGLVLCYPGDPSHPVAERAMPGPLRMIAPRHGRYEPVDGFDAFLT